jgi:ATP-dependent protease Clp ATPase subunit
VLGASCAFCSKRATEVKKVIADPTPEVAFCSQRIELCAEILAEDGSATHSPDPAA